MHNKKRKQYRGRWLVKLLESALLFGIVFFGLDALGQIFTPDSQEWVSIVYPTPIEGASLNLDNGQLDAQLDEEDYFNLALDHQLNGDYYDAIEDYSHSLMLNPHIPASWLNRGVAYEQLGYDADAMVNFYQYVNRTGLFMMEYQTIAETTNFVAHMNPAYRYDIPMTLYDGQTLDISVTSFEEDVVDPIIVLVDASGQPVAASDDMRRSDGSLITANSYISNYEVTESGEYTLIVTHAGGGDEGEIQISVNIQK